MGPPIVEGWMYRFGRHTLGRSYFHKRYFVLDRNILAYYKKKPAQNDVPIRSLHLDDNCRVEDRGLETHHGHWVYVLSVYKRQSSDRITLAALSNQDATVWKQNIQQIIDSANAEQTGQSNGNVHGTPGPTSPKGRHAMLLDQQSTLTDADFPSSRMLGDGLHAGESGSQGTDGTVDMLSPLMRNVHMSSDDLAKEEGERPMKGPLLRAETVGRGTPRELAGWDLRYDEEESLSSPRHPSTGQSGGRPHRRHWRLVGCSNSLRVFEEIPEPDQASKLRAMKSVGVVDATCENVFELVIAMDELRFEWDVSFMGGRVVEEVDGHTAVVHMWFGNDWMSSCVSPRDLCFVRYWRRNEDGTYVILSRSIEHRDCPPQPGFVRAQLESGGWIISPLKSRGGTPRARVQCLVQLDVNFGPLGGFTSFPRHTINQWLMSVAGMREFFAARDGDTPLLVRVPHNMGAGDTTPLGSGAASCLTGVIRVLRPGDSAMKAEQHVQVKNQHREEPMPSDSDDDDDQVARGQALGLGMATPERVMRAKRGVTLPRGGEGLAEEPTAPVGVPVSAQKLAGIQFPGTFQRGDHEKGQNCWSICEPSTFRVRSRRYLKDKSKVAAKRHLMELVAVDWLKAKRRIDHVAQCRGTAAQVAADNNLFSLVVNVQVPANGHYSMVFYFVAEWPLLPGSLLQRFVDGTDRFRNARLKLIPAVPKGPWIVRQSVGTTPCLLGKALECTYHSSEKYLEIDVDIGSSTVANGVLGLVFGYVTSLAVDMAFLIEATGEDELPEELLSAVRISRMRLDAAVPPPEDHEAFGDHPKKA